MRVAFELTGPGELWLDNVKLYDLLCPLKYYKDAQAEILQLLRRGHDAQGAYNAGQITDCIEQLDGYWPRFVKAYTPITAAKIATANPLTDNATQPGA